MFFFAKIDGVNHPGVALVGIFAISIFYLSALIDNCLHNVDKLFLKQPGLIYS
jgi:hypothetical protein